MSMLGRAVGRAFSQIGHAKALHARAARALALTCFLAGAFGLFLANLDASLHRNRGNAQFQVYWKPGWNMAEVRAGWDALRALPGVDSVTGFTPEEALESLKKTLNTGNGGGGGFDLSWLGPGSPLPATALAQYRADAADARAAQVLLERIKALPGVDTVRISPLQLDVAQAVRTLSAKVLLPLSLSLSLAIAVVAYLAARLCLEGRRAEVEILRLVGAREWFVRLPWAISAGLTGLAGALAGLGALRATQAALSGVLYEPPLWIKLIPLPLEEAGAMALLALCMSALGGWLAAGE